MAEERGFLNRDPIQQSLEGIAITGDTAEIGCQVLATMVQFLANGATQPTLQAVVRPQPDAVQENLRQSVDGDFGGAIAGHACTLRTARWIPAASLLSGSISVTAPR